MNLRSFGKGRYKSSAAMKKYGDVFQRMSDFENARNVNMKMFIEFCISDLGIIEPPLICTKSNMVRFLSKIALDKAKKARYEKFMSDVDRVAEDVMESGCRTTT